MKSFFSTDPVSHKGKTDVWLTPLELIAPLGRFDLDPCGEADHKTADTIYTENGLEKPWFGKVWLNPPYSSLYPWLKKLADHADSGGCGIALVFARTDTAWFQEIADRSTGLFFPKGRIKFQRKDGSTPGSPGAPSVFIDFRLKPDWEKLGIPGIEAGFPIRHF